MKRLIAALALLLFAGKAQAQVVAYSATSPTDPRVSIHLTCEQHAEEDGGPRCALVNVYKPNTAEEEWTMGAGYMQQVQEEPPLFCFVADTAEYGDEEGSNGTFPPILGRQACFRYEGGTAHLFWRGSFLRMEPNPDLAKGITGTRKANKKDWRST